MTQNISEIDIDSRGVLFQRSLARLRAWLEENDYAGIEPHDALTSPLFRKTPLGRSQFLRLAALQGLRRLPVDMRPLLGVHPHINAVSLGWALSGYAVIDDDDARRRIDWALATLKELEIPGYSGACWGYYFDWQTRKGLKPAHAPIIVSTSFIGIGLIDIYEKYGREDCLQWGRSACDFIINDLNRTPGKNGFCFSYSPSDHECVFNATMLGAELLARVGKATGEMELIEMARETVRFVMDHQAKNGSWPYGIGENWQFIDNFHTGYVLCSLKRYIESSGDELYRGGLINGWRFYRDHFFLNGYVPKYYHDRPMPVDAHAAAESIVTLLEFDDIETAARVAEWTINNMQTEEGYFIYQIHRRFTNRIPYLRWSNAYMLQALARLCSKMYIHPVNS